MWKLKLKVCLINFLVYSLCTFLLYLCFHWQALHRQDFGPTAIGYVYKQEGGNTNDYYYYYKQGHYRPLLGKKLLERIYEASSFREVKKSFR